MFCFYSQERNSNRFLSLSIVLFVVASGLYRAGAIAQKNNPCDKKFNEAAPRLKILDASSRISTLKEIARTCPNHVATLVALGDAYSDANKNVDENWLQYSLDYYQKATEVEPLNIDAKWGRAKVYEYIGEYGKAAWLYKGLIADKTKLTKERLSEVQAHLFTCEYLLKIKKPTTTSAAANSEDNLTKKTGANKDAKKKTEKLDVSEKAIRDRSAWDVLKESAEAIAVQVALSKAGADGEHVQYALNLLQDWWKAPQGQTVNARNNFLVGMITTLANIVIEKNLGIKLSTNAGVRELGNVGKPLSANTFANQSANGFKSDATNPAVAKASGLEGKKIEISKDLTIIEKTDVPNIAGEYECIDCPAPYNHSGTFSNTVSGTTMTTTLYPLVIEQSGASITLRSKMEFSSSGVSSEYMTVTPSNSVTTAAGNGILSNSEASIDLVSTTTSSGGESTGIDAELNGLSQKFQQENQARENSFRQAAANAPPSVTKVYLRVVGEGEIQLTTSSGYTTTQRYRRVR